jgi:hypothetical protein
MNPLETIGLPEDLKGAVALLASPALEVKVTLSLLTPSCILNS